MWSPQRMVPPSRILLGEPTERWSSSEELGEQQSSHLSDCFCGQPWLHVMERQVIIALSSVFQGNTPYPVLVKGDGNKAPCSASWLILLPPFSKCWDDRNDRYVHSNLPTFPSQILSGKDISLSLSQYP